MAAKQNSGNSNHLLESDPAIISFQPANGIGNLNNSSQELINSKSSAMNGHRETGIIEKLLKSYGFIQCCDREGRLFFHFSQYNGDVNNIKIGEPVEFEESIDKRTGKPIAVSIVSKPNRTVNNEVYSEAKFVGRVTVESKVLNEKSSANGVRVVPDGRLTYERNGEVFYIPYGMEDVTGGKKQLQVGDPVSFYVAADKNSQYIRAREVELVNVSHVENGGSISPRNHQKLVNTISNSSYSSTSNASAVVANATNNNCSSSSAAASANSPVGVGTVQQGVVCSLKETFGFIERSDIVRQIFFHFSEFRGDTEELKPGLEVQFDVQERNGKEVATRIIKMPYGTVQFDNISTEKYIGRVIKPLPGARGRKSSEPFPGKLIYDTLDGMATEIPFGDRDQKGEFTLLLSDIVGFQIATDRRDKLQRATNIELLEQSFVRSKERREVGTIHTLKEAYGFIKYIDHEGTVFFHFSEVMKVHAELCVGDEVEFTIVKDPNEKDKDMAIRIKLMTASPSQSKEMLSEKSYTGTVQKEIVVLNSPRDDSAHQIGTITYEEDNQVKTVQYRSKDVVGTKLPDKGDKVEFHMMDSDDSRPTAVMVKVITAKSNSKHKGFIATLKERYGFIENETHDKEVFFSFSAFEGDHRDLELGDEVEYTTVVKNGKVSADKVRKLAKGSVNPEESIPGTYEGIILRPVRAVNPDQDEYWGLVQMVTPVNKRSLYASFDGELKDTYRYGVTSLVDKKTFIQRDDRVNFRLSRVVATGELRATNIATEREIKVAKVDAIKDMYGFIDYEAVEGRKLFFHKTEIQDGADLNPGDEVEFVLIQNQRNGKYSACNVRRINSPFSREAPPNVPVGGAATGDTSTNATPRPERLTRLKSAALQDCTNGRRIVALRQPRGPDAGRGFKLPRVTRLPGTLIECSTTGAML